MEIQHNYRGGSLNKVWLKRYPADVPAEISADRYTSLVDLFEQAAKRYADQPAFVNMGQKMSYRQLEEKSRAFAAYLQQQLGLGAGLLNLALKGAQLLMKAPPDLAHQPNLPCCRPCPGVLGVVKTLARPLVLDQPGRRARSSASRSVVQSATRAACCRLPLDPAVSPLLDQAATWRRQPQRAKSLWLHSSQPDVRADELQHDQQLRADRQLLWAGGGHESGVRSWRLLRKDSFTGIVLFRHVAVLPDGPTGITQLPRGTLLCQRRFPDRQRAPMLQRAVRLDQ